MVSCHLDKVHIRSPKRLFLSATSRHRDRRFYFDSASRKPADAALPALTAVSVTWRWPHQEPEEEGRRRAPPVARQHPLE